MRIYDISLPVSPNLPVWPGDPSVIMERVQKMEDGASANVTHLCAGVHIGTHVDAPYHFLGGDTATVERLPLKILTGRAYVMDLPGVELITAEAIKAAGLPPRTRRLLLRTRNSRYWAENVPGFQADFVALSPDGAHFLVDQGVKLVGVDYLSVAPFREGAPTHQALLKAGIVIVEGLDLSNIPPGRYTLHCLPLKLVGSDGAPARAILVGV